MMLDTVGLLSELISHPSLSRQEEATADVIERTLIRYGVEVNRLHNNVWAKQPNHSIDKLTLLLNSHHDTVKPSASYTRNPFSADIEDGKLYGLGSNDAGASVVSLMSVFIENYHKDLPFNIVLAITAEEEVMGENGMRAMLPHFKIQGVNIDMALVGEPTGMQPAVAERGLVVLDCVTHGVTGHAARGEGVNAIYKAMADIERLCTFKFEQKSEVLGDIGLQITQINAGTQHNVVPAECKWVVDVRTTDAYSNEQTVELIREVLEDTEATPRSTRVHASVISSEHPMVKAAVALGRETFVSPTTSDMALMYDFPSLKMGPGQSHRSHSADEYVLVSEVDEAIDLYQKFIEQLSLIIEQK